MLVAWWCTCSSNSWIVDVCTIYFKVLKFTDHGNYFLLTLIFHVNVSTSYSANSLSMNLELADTGCHNHHNWRWDGCSRVLLCTGVWWADTTAGGDVVRCNSLLVAQRISSQCWRAYVNIQCAFWNAMTSVAFWKVLSSWEVRYFHFLHNVWSWNRQLARSILMWAVTSSTCREAKRGQIFGATLFSSYGAFW